MWSDADASAEELCVRTISDQSPQPHEYPGGPAGFTCCKAEMSGQKTRSISEALSVPFMIVIKEWTRDASSQRCAGG
ncbi:hypothetical protein AOLI_G00090030 [Acnodon oligacanthus]